MANRYWVGGTGTWNASSTANWSNASGGAAGASAPTSADAVFFDSNSGTGVVTTAAGSASAAITVNSANIELKLGANHSASGTCTLTIGTLNLNNFTLSLTGNFGSNNSNSRTLAFGTSGKISTSNNNATVWGAATITNLVVTGTPAVDLTYSGGTGTRTVQHGFTAGGSAATAVSFNITAGTDTISFGRHVKNLNLTGFSGTFTSANVTVYGDITFSPTMTLTDQNAGFNFTPSFGQSVVTINGVSVVNNLIFNAGTTGSSVRFADGYTTTRAVTVNGGNYIFKDGATYTYAAGNPVFNTSATSPVTFSSSVPGTQYTFSCPSGTTTAQYATISDSNATGGATWNAFVDQFNTDAGGNDGWDFGVSPVVGGAEYTYQLRSFTEPRRF